MHADTVRARTPGNLQQVGYVTDDLDAAIRRWIGSTGIGPWTVYRNVVLAGEFCGRPCSVKMDVGLSYQGDLQIELIEPKTPAPSPYHDRDGRRLIGMHHVAWLSDDLAVDLARAVAQNLAKMFDASNEFSHVAYLTSPGEPGLILEYIQLSAEVRSGYARAIETCRSWDGVTQPVTTIDLER